jgi:hypothetical protein
MFESPLTFLSDILTWIRNNNITLIILGITSAITFVGTLILVPILVVRLPADYFAHSGRHRRPWLTVHPIPRVLLLIGKNVLGFVLVCAGILMLVLPGQGILTILIGLTLIDFPGKFTFERWLVTRPAVLKSVNWLRHKAGRTHLTFVKEAD